MKRLLIVIKLAVSVRPYSELFDYHDNGIVGLAAEEMTSLKRKFLPQTMFSRLLKNAPLVLSLSKRL